MNYPKGEILVCIDNSGQEYLTIGKHYKLLNEYSHDVGCQVLNDDNDNNIYYNVNRFCTLSSYREKTILRILDDKNNFLQ